MARLSADIPYDLITNVYTLDGFEEFAYMVCTIALTPNNVPGQPEVPRESTLSRLKNAEKDLRSVSILVSLDPEKGELFTFYRKSYVMKDQKELITKFRPVLQRNYCIISYRSGGAIGNLLRPDQSRIYGLFVRAILASVQDAIRDDGDKIPFGPRAYLICKDLQPEKPSVDFDNKPNELWHYCVFDVQILSVGTILITTTIQQLDLIRSPSKSMLDGAPRLSSFVLPLILCLAPVGQLGRYVGGRFGTMPLPSRPPKSPILSPEKLEASDQERQRMWARRLRAWLQQQDHFLADWEEQVWIEVEIPVSESGDVSAEASSIAPTIWKTIIWPSSLCFLASSTLTNQEDNKQGVQWTSNDPWEFVQHWAETSDEKLGAKSRKDEASRKELGKGASLLDYENSEDDLQLGYTPQFQNLGPLDFPPSQLIYPTPPDVALTQATPGMSSFDGIDMTPANAVRHLPELPEDVDMADIEDTHNGRVGSGFYDEDLFEEMPSDKFGPAGVVDEPNWDFFDQQDLEMPDVVDSVRNVNNSQLENVDENQEESHVQSGGLIGKQSSEPDPTLQELHQNELFSESAQPDEDGHKKMQGLQLMLDDRSAKESRSISPHAEPGRSPNSSSKERLNNSTKEDSSEVVLSADDFPLGSPIARRDRRRSSYESVPFDLNTMTFDEKYAIEGQFWFDAVNDLPKSAQPSNAGIVSSAPPLQVDYLRRRTPSSSIDDSESNSSNWPSPIGEIHQSQGDNKQKWTEYTPAASESTKAGPDQSDLLQIEQDIDLLIDLLHSETYDLPITQDTRYAVGFLPQRLGDSLEELNMTAQLLVDQLSQSSFQNRFQNLFGLQNQGLNGRDASLDFRDGDSEWDRADLGSFCQLGFVTESADSSPIIYKLEPFRICMSTIDKPLEAYPTILPLWDTLNLHPQGGSKDVSAFCLHPGGLNLEDGCDVFLSRISEMYINCSLGTHAIGKISGTTDNGVLSWASDDGSSTNLIPTYERLGRALARASMPPGTILIYIINASTQISSYVALCNAFHSLFMSYCKAFEKQKPSDIAFQIIPLSFVASPDTVVVPTQAEYLELALEVYNRCPPTQRDDQLALCGSAVTLAESWNKSVNFDLAVTSVSPLSKSGKCLHLCYSQSLDLRWITAAWTDERGYIALTMSYCLRPRGSTSSRTQVEVFRDMWEVSQELMTKHRSRWQLVVAKDRYYEIEEINDWLFLANDKSSEKKSGCSLVLISIDLNPLIALQTPPQPPKPTQGFVPSQQGYTAGTPVSTPQAVTTTSPEQFLAATPTPTPGGPIAVNAPTPPADHAYDPTTDSDLMLSNPAEESWSVVLSFGLNQSTNILDVRPAMLSGFLIKRCGPKDEDGFVSLGVSLIHTSIPAQDLAAREELLGHIITQYRALTVLSVTRGCLVHPDREAVPWHVATAVKGARILGIVL